MSFRWRSKCITQEIIRHVFYDEFEKIASFHVKDSVISKHIFNVLQCHKMSGSS